MKNKRPMRLIPIALILLIILTYSTFCDGHYHDHDDHYGHSYGMDERTDFKYSQEPNKAYEQHYGYPHEEEASPKYSHEELHSHNNRYGHNHEGHGQGHHGHGQGHHGHGQGHH